MPAALPGDLVRYGRQVLLPHFGVDGQRRLGHANVTLIGCGALGSALAGTLVRAGVGRLRIVDRDFLETGNLQRQTLFDEHDVSQNLPKAEAAARKLRRINSAVEVEGRVADVTPATIRSLAGEPDLLLDGTDNLLTRYLVNDYAVREQIPWVFGAVVATEGLVLAVRPGQSACLRCVWPEPPAPGTLPTCDTAGVLATAVQAVAALQATEALKLLLGREDQLLGRLIAIDAWTARIRQLDVQAAFEAGDCPCCARREFDFADGRRYDAATVLCGREAVQITPPHDPERPAPNFRALAERLPARAAVKWNEFLLRFTVEEIAPFAAGGARRPAARYQITLFSDARAIVQGTSDPAVARTLLAKYVGT
jgi:adenylyltransferase/sulfurtransferase